MTGSPEVRNTEQVPDPEHTENGRPGLRRENRGPRQLWGGLTPGQAAKASGGRGPEEARLGVGADQPKPERKASREPRVRPSKATG